MATSGVYDEAWTVGEVIAEAFKKAKIGIAGEPLSNEELQAGLNSLQMMLRTWAARGVRLWIEDEQSVTLVNGTAVYTLDPRTLEITYAFRRSNNNDVPVRVITHREYANLPNKTTVGSPFAVYPHRDRTATTVTMYPVPGAAEVAAAMTMRLIVKRQIQDPTAIGEDLDWPPEWLEPIVYNLAARISPDFGVSIDPVVAGMAQSLYDDLEAQDREESVYFRPGVRR